MATPSWTFPWWYPRPVNRYRWLSRSGATPLSKQICLFYILSFLHYAPLTVKLTLSTHDYLIPSLKWRIHRSDLRSALRAASGIQLANLRYLFAISTFCQVTTIRTEPANGSHRSSMISYFDLLARVWWTTNEDAHGTSAEMYALVSYRVMRSLYWYHDSFRLITTKSRTISTWFA